MRRNDLENGPKSKIQWIRIVIDSKNIFVINCEKIGKSQRRRKVNGAH